MMLNAMNENQHSTRTFAILFGMAWLLNVVGTVHGDDTTKMDQARLAAVIQFAETVLTHGRDRYGEKHTPLFTETLDVDTMAAPDRMYIFRLNKPSPRQWQPWQPTISSNIAYQGNLMRVFVGVSNLTGEPKYKEAYKDSIRYYFQHYQNPSGMLHTGHHRFIDLKADRYDGDDWPPGSRGHEMKGDMPWYDIFWEADPVGTRRMLDGHWNSHIKNWDTMDFTRHGYYHKTLEGDVWDRPLGDPVQGIIKGDLTFFDSFTDIAWAGGKHSLLTQDDRSRQWTRRLLARYIDNAHENTGIPPCHHTLVRDFASANGYPNESWPEYALLTASPSESMFSHGATMLLRLADELGEEKGAYFRESVCAYLKAYAKHAYFADDNSWRAILYDGHDLSRKVRPNTEEREWLFPNWQAHPGYMLSYAQCYRLTRDTEILSTLHSICRGNELGDIGLTPGATKNLNMETQNSDPRSVFALIELFRTTNDEDYLNLARVVANNALQQRFDESKGLFVKSKLHKTANLNATEPLAFLRLEAVLRGRLNEVPTYDGSTLGNVFDILRPTQSLPYHPTVSHRTYPSTEFAMCDELIPETSNDTSIPHHSWYRGRHKQSAVALFPDILSGPVEIKGAADVSDSPRRLKGITIDSPFSYRFVQPGGLQMQEDFVLTVLQGKHEWEGGSAWYPSMNANYVFEIAQGGQFTFNSVIYEYHYSGHRSGLIKNGAGTLVLTGDNTPLLKERPEDNRAYQGDTVINDGLLLVENTIGSGISPQSAIHIKAGGTLGGNGTIGTGDTRAVVHVEPGGTIAAGGKYGALTLRDGLSLTDQSHLHFDLTDDKQLLRVTGKNSKTEDNARIRISITGPQNLNRGDTFDLIDWKGTMPPGLESKNFVIDGTSEYTGELHLNDNRLQITISAPQQREFVEEQQTIRQATTQPTQQTTKPHELFRWTNPQGGTWTEPANWSGDDIPNGRPREWAQYTFDGVRQISAVELYWLDDGGNHRVPDSWEVLYRVEDEWHPVHTMDDYSVAKDQFNSVQFTPVKTDALRLIVYPQSERTAGILEWKVSP